MTTSLYALEAGASEFLVGALIGLYGLLPTFLSIAMGRLVDRIGPFVPMRAGIASSLSVSPAGAASLSRHCS